MGSQSRNVALGVLLVLLAITFYPALMLGRRLAPEAYLRGIPPWRLAWGPSPAPPARALAAATQLGPRLAIIEREGLAAALWNPWIGGGRAGWLSSPAEGGSLLPLLAVFFARTDWVWSALVALTLTASFTAAWFAARWTGASAWASAAAAAAYSLCGPVAGYWLDWRGAGLALGPLAILPALVTGRTWAVRLAAWSGAGTLVLLGGAPAAQFVALAIAAELVLGGRRGAGGRAATVLAALVLITLVRLPVTWLGHAGREPGAAAEAAGPESPAVSLLSFVRPMQEAPLDSRLPVLPPSGDEAPAPASLLGLAALLLALIGGLALHGRQRAFWVAVVVVSVALAVTPPTWLAVLGMRQRPLAVLALAVAVLAAHGLDAVLCRLRRPWASPVGALVCAVLVAELAPQALHELPFAPISEGRLASPLPGRLPDDGSRVATIMSALPPDIAASFGLADARARRYDGEPTYEKLVRARAASPALDPVLARVGARWLLEPLTLRQVSAEVFGDVSIVEAPLLSAAGASPARYRVGIPPDTCRLGLPRGETADAAVFLQGQGGTVALEEDRALAEESADWRWLAVDADMPHGDVMLGLIGQRRARESLSIAIDRSGVRLAGESVGLRVWEWERARPFAYLTPTNEGSRVRVVELKPARAVIDVESASAPVLVMQLKYRPSLWRITVNGKPAGAAVAEAVWTAVSLPPGRSRVVAAAAVPAPIWLAAMAAVIITALLGVFGRER